MLVESDMDLGSDHKPVCLTFTPSPPPPPQFSHPRQLWHLSKFNDEAKYSEYQRQFRTALPPVPAAISEALNQDADHPMPDINHLSE